MRAQLFAEMGRVNENDIALFALGRESWACREMLASQRLFEESATCYGGVVTHWRNCVTVHSNPSGGGNRLANH